MFGFFENPDQKQLLMKVHVPSDYHDFGWAKFVFEIVKKNHAGFPIELDHQRD